MAKQGRRKQMDIGGGWQQWKPRGVWDRPPFSRDKKKAPFKNPLQPQFSDSTQIHP